MSEKSKNVEKKVPVTSKQYIFVGKTGFYGAYFFRKNSVYDSDIVNDNKELKEFFKEL